VELVFVGLNHRRFSEKLILFTTVYSIPC